MKARKIFILMLFFFIFFILYSYNKNIFKDIGPHGGRVKSAGSYNIEMKVASHNFQAFLLDNQLNPISNKGMTCEIRFFLCDSSTIDIDLKPFGDDAFMVESSLKGYYYYNVVFHVFGKQIKAKFEDENLIVLNK